MIIINSKKLFSAVILGLIIGGGFNLSLQAKPADKAEKQIKKRIKKDQVTDLKNAAGKVNVISEDHISIVYKTNLNKGIKYEIGFKITDSLRQKYDNLLKRIERGDTVRVEYREVKENFNVIYKDGSSKEGSKVVSREAVAIHFIKSKGLKFYSGE